jgi:hypothetical protein
VKNVKLLLLLRSGVQGVVLVIYNNCWGHCTYHDPVACFLPSLFFKYNFIFCVEKRIKKTKLILVLYKYANKKAEHAVLLRNTQTRRQRSIVRLGNLKTNEQAKNF